jgi:hypothetical protein
MFRTLVAVPPVPANDLFLVWTSGGLPEGLAGTVAALPGVENVAEVRSDTVYLAETYDASAAVVDATSDGFLIPVEVFAIDPSTYEATLPPSGRVALGGLSDTSALLGSSSAEVRHLTAGGSLVFESGSILSVAGIVDDVLVGGAEVVVNRAVGKQLGVLTPRFLLVTYQGERSDFERAVRDLIGISTLVRIRAPGETPFMRHGDAVLPQAIIKRQFGEFSIRPGSGASFTADPSWVEASIVTADLPLIGTVTCHRSFIPLLQGALDQLVSSGLTDLVDPNGFRGCWNPRFISGSRSLSRHAWGVAVDLNFDDNPTGETSSQDPRLVEVMLRWGLTWGGNWLVPDPAHFESAMP